MGKFVFKDWLDNRKEGDNELLYASIHRTYWREWAKTLRAYLADPKDFYNAEWFLEQHPANQRLAWGSPDGWFSENLWWHVTKVDPVTKRIESKKNPNWKKNGKGKHPPDKNRNTETNVWVEWGPYIEHSDDPNVGSIGIASHEARVDTGGATFEEAIINLAHNVWKLYGANAKVSHKAKLSKEDRW